MTALRPLLPHPSSLLVRKAQRALGTTLEEDEDEDSVCFSSPPRSLPPLTPLQLDDLSVDSDDSDPLGRVVSFMEDVSPKHPTSNPKAKMCLETNSEEEEEAPQRRSMTDTIRKSFQMFSTVNLDESDEEGEGAEDEEDKQPSSMRFFFCCG